MALGVNYLVAYYSVRYLTGMCGNFIPAMNSMVSRWYSVPFTVASGADTSTVEVEVDCVIIFTLHFEFLGKGPLSSIVVEPFQNTSLCDITVPPTSGQSALMEAFQPRGNTPKL